MTQNSHPYRTLFVCELEQCSSLSVGGGDETGPSDMPLLRDGNGNFFIRGSSLAGALVATARAVFGTVPSRISRIDRDDDSGLPSSWSFDHGRLVIGDGMPVPVPELRAGSPHRQDTRTAADRGLHDIEVLPPLGQVWRFLLDVDFADAASGSGTPEIRDDVIAALALREWAQGRCWLGRRAARGLGWMQLKKCEVFPLQRRHVDSWPNSFAASLADRIAEIGKLDVSKIDLDTFIGQAKSLHPGRRYLRWTGTARAGEYRPDTNGASYGLDTLEIGGHGSHYMTPEEFGKRFVLSEEIDKSALNDIKPDMALAMVHRLDKDKRPTLVPFIPGTSLAGSFRHWLSRQLRINNQRIWDPVAQSDYQDATGDAAPDFVELLMGTRRGSGAGTKRRASALLFREAHLTDDGCDGWSATCLERVALDPYRQKPAPGSKFNRYALLGAEFEWQIVLELGTTANDPDPVALIESFLAAASASRVGFGGGEARGHGHLAFTVVWREEALAGAAAWQPKDSFRAAAGV